MLEGYEKVEHSEDFLSYEFISSGPRGNIIKVVKYTEINVKGFFNLGFGDKDPISGFISDIKITNNLDSQRVLATVVNTLLHFFMNYPNANVIATGSTDSRTRLYRIGITNNLAQAQLIYDIFGLTEIGWEVFKKSTNYAAFLIRKKM